ncbi:MAG TPA: tungstate ABC transporter substrate-binding protein WtpA [Phycisphaerales bacterium]|nr:tungstate ABC transporter substrate-binding protein WtpA [Phycisphaerales bacterium]
MTLIAVFIIIIAAGCAKEGPPRSDKELIIFHAGSLSVPFRDISAAFNELRPDVTIKAEAAGSRACARKISDLKRQCDVMASADYKVIANLLMPEYADFNIQFAANEMAIAYTKKSRFAEQITAENWHEILLKENVAIGRADPDLDPCGYRTVMALQLAQKHYNIPGLADKLLNKEWVIRPKETDLLVLLEAGEIDYVFIYRSVASQHGLEILFLPDQINLKSSDMKEFYNTAKVEVSGKEPGETIIRTGEPMIYAVTICKDAPNPKVAADYVAFLLSPKGQAIIERNGQEFIQPPKAFGYDYLPEKIKPLCKPVD